MKRKKMTRKTKTETYGNERNLIEARRKKTAQALNLELKAYRKEI